MAQKAQIILECATGKGKTVKTIVLMEEFDAELVSRGQECGVEIISLADFEVRKTTLLGVFQICSEISRPV